MKQYIVCYPKGTCIDETGEQHSNQDLALLLTKALCAGRSVAVPDAWSIQVIDLPEPINNMSFSEEDKFQQMLEKEYP